MHNNCARLAVVLGWLATASGAEAPQSAIPWLSESLERADRFETRAPLTPQVVVGAGAGPDADAAGLFPAASAGLSHGMWIGADTDRVLDMLMFLPI